MDARRSPFYQRQVGAWQEQHERVRRDGGPIGHPRPFVEAALHATLARLRCYPTRWELLRANDMTQAADLACIRSLMEAIGAADGLARSIRAAALYLRSQELAAMPDGPCAPSPR